MKKYKINITIDQIQADDKDHALEQAKEMLKDNQYSPDIKRLYSIDDLPSEALEKILDEYKYMNVEYFDWFHFIYEEAEGWGFEIVEFDIDRASFCKIKLNDDMQTICKAILKDTGESTELYKIAKKYQFKHGEDNQEEFTRELQEEYLSLLRQEFEYQTSDKVIKDCLCDYEFVKRGLDFVAA